MTSEGNWIHLALDIDHGSVPMAGRVTGEGGVVRTFVGWTGLAAALTDLFAQTPEVGGPDLPSRGHDTYER